MSLCMDPLWLTTVLDGITLHCCWSENFKFYTNLIVFLRVGVKSIQHIIALLYIPLHLVSSLEQYPEFSFVW
jgi:hypothetical protein